MDDAFDAGVGGRAPVRTPVRYSVELGHEICARIAAGESEHTLARAPGMPCRRTFRDWAQRDPIFAAHLMRAKLTARDAALRRDREVEAAKVWRRSLRRKVDRRGGQPTTYSEAMAEAVCARVAAGGSVVAIGADPAMPCARTISRWLRQQEAFREMYEDAKAAGADLLFDTALEIAMEATEVTVKADSLRGATLKWWIAMVNPPKYGPLRLAPAPEDEPEVIVEVRKFCEGPDKIEVPPPPPPRTWREPVGAEWC
ncbi:hypothetical protein [Phenylobacterium aquaticum]|uniref:terminase small subunit-like protein n=1 Tax=Phenylobacterium aquaticum TaxID=1763816 RepID=UPI001F5DE272|nr:hypothetical protein [Phenylobacterium aquaticum]MCI3135032.1 hypothetical protein [Phenylobacterium aquaticum]